MSHCWRNANIEKLICCPILVYYIFKYKKGKIQINKKSQKNAEKPNSEKDNIKNAKTIEGRREEQNTFISWNQRRNGGEFCAPDKLTLSVDP
jgi:hypothetical protein